MTKCTSDLTPWHIFATIIEPEFCPHIHVFPCKKQDVGFSVYCHGHSLDVALWVVRCCIINEPTQTVICSSGINAETMLIHHTVLVKLKALQNTFTNR